MNIHFEKSLLMSGDDYKLTPYLTLRNPTIREMRTINNGYESEQLYWNYVHFILSDPYSNMVFLDDIGKDFTKTSSFEVFMLHWNDSILEALQFFTREKHPFVKSQYDDGSSV